MPTYKENWLERIEIRDPLIKYPDVPLIVDDWTLAFRLGFTGKVFWYILQNRHKMYREFLMKKKSGGMRKVFDPNDLIRTFQMQLRTRVLLPLCSRLGPHVSAYQLNKSTIDAATSHLRACSICEETTRPGTRNVKHVCPRTGFKFKLDLKDFFLSTSQALIRGYFHQVVGYNHYASSLLGTLLTTTYKDEKRRTRNGVPPGALTAGDICNLVADWKIDQPMMQALPGWRYSRYADDLYFSHDGATSAQIDYALKTAREVIRASGFRVNEKKTQKQPWGRPQRILGININRKLNIPAHEFERMHNILYHARKYGFEQQLKFAKKENVGDLHAWIVGKLNYFNQFAPHRTEKLRKLYVVAKEANKSSDVTVFNFENGKAVAIPTSEIA